MTADQIRSDCFFCITLYTRLSTDSFLSGCHLIATMECYNVCSKQYRCRTHHCLNFKHLHIISTKVHRHSVLRLDWSEVGLNISLKSMSCVKGNALTEDGVSIWAAYTLLDHEWWNPQGAYFGGTMVFHHYSCNLSYHLFLWITGYGTEGVTEWMVLNKCYSFFLFSVWPL